MLRTEPAKRTSRGAVQSQCTDCLSRASSGPLSFWRCETVRFQRGHYDSSVVLFFSTTSLVPTHDVRVETSATMDRYQKPVSAQWLFGHTGLQFVVFLVFVVACWQTFFCLLHGMGLFSHEPFALRELCLCPFCGVWVSRNLIRFVLQDCVRCTAVGQFLSTPMSLAFRTHTPSPACLRLVTLFPGDLWTGASKGGCAASPGPRRHHHGRCHGLGTKIEYFVTADEIKYAWRYEISSGSKWSIQEMAMARRSTRHVLL